MRKRRMVGTFLAAAATLLFLGCSSSNSSAPTLSPTSGQHPATWVQTHWQDYTKAPNSCVPCHGSAQDPAAAGGTSQVSCFGCHHPNGPNHPANWADRAQHGRLGAQAAATPGDNMNMMGFASCTPCHGADYNTPIGAAPSCFSCHPQAPHGIPPWGATATPVDSTTHASHDQTDISNAPECFKCHAAGSPNNSITPKTPAAPNTPPGCFNGTLCHTNSF